MYKRREFTETEKRLSERIRDILEDSERAISVIRDGREKSIALSHIEDAMLHANLAISEDGIIGEVKE